MYMRNIYLIPLVLNYGHYLYILNNNFLLEVYWQTLPFHRLDSALLLTVFFTSQKLSFDKAPFSSPGVDCVSSEKSIKDIHRSSPKIRHIAIQIQPQMFLHGALWVLHTYPGSSGEVLFGCPAQFPMTLSQSSQTLGAGCAPILRRTESRVLDSTPCLWSSSSRRRLGLWFLWCQKCN